MESEDSLPSSQPPVPRPPGPPSRLSQNLNRPRSLVVPTLDSLASVQQYEGIDGISVLYMVASNRLTFRLNELVIQSK
jgi:hypothetical protein